MYKQHKINNMIMHSRGQAWFFSNVWLGIAEKEIAIDIG